MLRIYMILCIPLLEQDSVCCVQYSFYEFWYFIAYILTLLQNLPISQTYSVKRVFHDFDVVFFLFCLNGKCRLGKFQVFFYINFTVWTVSIFIITLRLYDLSSKLYHYTVYFLLKTTKYFQCINVMFNPCACMCDLIIHCIIFQVKLALLTLWICQ